MLLPAELTPVSTKYPHMYIIGNWKDFFFKSGQKLTFLHFLDFGLCEILSLLDPSFLLLLDPLLILFA